MFGASIAIAEETEHEEHPEHDGLVPVGLQALLIADDSSNAASASSPTRNAASSIASMYIELPPLDQANQPVQKEGFLHKIGGNVKNWKTRYFRLCPGRLMYYKDGENLSPDGRLGAILLPGASIAIFSPDVHPGHAYCFGLTPADGDRQYVFDCDSVAHRTEWIQALTPSTRQRIKVVPESAREGFLTKLGGNVKNWKRRYCVLTKTALKYYPSYNQLEECLGTVDLTGGFVVGSDDDPNVTSSSSSAAAAAAAAKEKDGSASSNASNFLANNPYNFSLRPHNMDRTYIFCTTTKQDRDGWIGVLQEVQKSIKI